MFTALSLAVFSLAPTLAPVNVRAPAPVPEPPAKVKVEWKITCDDGSTFNVVALDTAIPLKTKYGDLKIPVESIKKIELANRLSPLVRGEVEGHIKNLAHPDFKIREEATAALRGLGHRSYPLVVAACKSSDPEVSRRADEAARYIRQHSEPSLLALRPDDVITTADSKLSGQIALEGLKVQTGQFGEQSLRLTDMRVVTIKGAASTPVNADVAPANMSAYSNQAGKEFTFKLVGMLPQQAQTPGIWGSDVYTLDSNLAVAAVHAGVLRPGEEGVVKVRLVPSPGQFVATDRNGVNSVVYGPFPNGAYEFVRTAP